MPELLTLGEGNQGHIWDTFIPNITAISVCAYNVKDLFFSSWLNIICLTI